MGAPTYTLPTVGNPNSTEDPLVRTALSDLKTLLTDGLDDSNLATGGVGSGSLASNAVTTAKITDANVTAAKLGAASVSLVLRLSHTFAFGGTLAVPSGSVDVIPPFFVPKATNQTVKLIAARHIIGSGTSATAKLQTNGVDTTGFTGISVTTTATTTDPADVTLAADDKIQLILTAVSGSPANLSFSLYFEHTVTN